MPSQADLTARSIARLLEAIAAVQRAQMKRLRRASEAVDRLEKAQAEREKKGEERDGPGWKAAPRHGRRWFEAGR